jgi:hypothetical protein
MNGFDNCIVGIVERFGISGVLCYDKTLVLKALQRQGMSAEEAEEYFYYNMHGAWVGEGTPCFLEKMKPKEALDWAAERTEESEGEEETRENKSAQKPRRPDKKNRQAGKKHFGRNSGHKKSSL